MGLTPSYSLPYPELTDTADVPRDVKALADKLDTLLLPAGGGGATPLTSRPVLDVGLAGQIRAGRQLALADFTAMGLSAPVGLWNLSDLSDVSGNNRSLSNKGSVPFGSGINGLTNTAAVFAGSAAQALYIADTGAADPFRIRTGSWGCWFRTAKRGTSQSILSKSGSAGPNLGWILGIQPTNLLRMFASGDGTTAADISGVSDVCDDRWHFAVETYDGTQLRAYVDGVLEAAAAYGALIVAVAEPLNVGGHDADGSAAAASPFYGRVDEAFVTADVLSEDQIRNLYCAKIAHGYTSTPTRVSLNVRRRRRGGPLVPADFPAQPLRLHNLTNVPPGGSAWTTDQGSNGVPLSAIGAGLSSVAGADGSSDGAMNFIAASGGSLAATDAGLPSGTTARSYGCWFKTTNPAATNFLAWGTTSSGDSRFLFNGSGSVCSFNAADAITGPYASDGQWHFIVATEDNAAGDGVRRKMYLDGRLVGGSTVMNAITLAGANRFRIGAAGDGSGPFTGQVDGAFVCGYALTFEQVAALYAKGSMAMAPSPKNPGDHVEVLDAINVLAVFDTLGSQHTVDMGVAS